MSRKPEDQKPPREGRDALWEAIRTRKTFTSADLAYASDLDATTIGQYLKSLVKAGYLGFTRPDTRAIGAGFIYTLLKDAAEPPRVRPDGTEVTQGSGRQRMWSVMRARRQFTLADLRALASVKDHAVALEEVKTYLQYLERAGYIRNVNGKPQAHAAYLLIRDTGIKAPMVQRVHQVWDPNLKEVTWPLKPQDGDK